MLVARLALEIAKRGASLRRVLVREDDREVKLMAGLAGDPLELRVEVHGGRLAASLRILVPEAGVVCGVLDATFPRADGARGVGAIRGRARAVAVAPLRGRSLAALWLHAVLAAGGCALLAAGGRVAAFGRPSSGV